MPLSRSEQMARIRGRDTRPEMLVRRAIWARGLRYRLHSATPVGRPDIVFKGRRVAIFVDGCQWHGCPEHYARPRTNERFWARKLKNNVNRDRRQTRGLEEAGWTVVRVWEHAVLRDLEKVVDEIVWAHQGERRRGPDRRVFSVEPLTEDGSRERRRLVDLHDESFKKSEVRGRKPRSM